MNKGNIIITRNETSWECEDCGTIYDEELVVTVDDIVTYRGVYDGHFGNGDDLTDSDTVLTNVLEAMGYSVTNGS